MTFGLPIDDAIPPLLAALQAHGRAVLEAPPGAGKTTCVPLALLDAGLANGRIIMLEPRRLAARAAAERMAAMRGEGVGGTVGYRIRGESRVGRDTRIEVVTEGILTRMVQDAPDLPGVGAVIFDEFHERSLAADLGLALCLDVAGALRDDLMLLAMSATLDAGPVAELMGCSVVRAEGRAFAVETRWLDRPLGAGARRDGPMADLIVQAEAETRAQGGAILCFLPGEGEIRRVAGLLKDRVPADCAITPLFGAMPFHEQRAAIAPGKEGRKFVLATSIAETSLTIPDVRVVVDGGQSRRARFDPASGMQRLVTERVTRAEATQRAGRAGRVAEGVCYRLWTRGEDGALAAYPPAEIEAGDLTALALELALWGASAADMAFLTPPAPGAFGEAQALLRLLGALDAPGRITDHGRRLATHPLHPRLAHMLEVAGPEAAALAALMSERDILKGAGADLSRRLRALRDPKAGGGAVNHGARDRVKAEAKRLAARAGQAAQTLSPAQMAALAYPDRIARRRPGDEARFLLSGGRGAMMEGGDDLAGQVWLVVTDIDGGGRDARIRQALATSESELRAVLGNRMAWHEVCEWSKRDRRVIARRQERLGAVVVDDRIWKDVPPDRVARAMLDGVRDLGLRLDGAAARLAARVQRVRAAGHGDLPEMSEAGLLDRLEDWLLPMFDGSQRSEDDWKRFDPYPALQAWLGWDGQKALDRHAPPAFETPLGRRVPIDYSGDAPAIEVRLQEMFGVHEHPEAAGQPIKITLLSPARRPVQVTTDLPGFWDSSYADVRKDMRGRYPKHPWPEDPRNADPTLRAKPRGT